MTTSITTCHLCEAVCGLVLEHDGPRITSLRAHEADVHSRGHLCPKAAAIGDVSGDPDRIREPMLKTASGEWRSMGWDEALTLACDRLARTQAEYGRDAVAFYYGNPTGHSSGAMLYAVLFAEVLATKNRFSTMSVDALPRVLTSYLLYGNQALVPVPDIDRTDFLLVLGANPIVSNGSAVSAPAIKKRLRALRRRGGRLVVVDPRRNETAAIADQHLPIVPGSDALLLAALLHVVFARGLDRLGHLADHVDGLAELREAVQPFAPERVAPHCAIDAPSIEALAVDFARAERAVCYGRMVTCTQRFGTLTTCLIDALNLVTGNLDRPGGSMFTSPVVDLAGLAALLGQRGHFDRWRSRVSGLPEFNGEIPVASMAEEMDTPGPGQVRALVVHAGNPVLAIPDGRRLDASLTRLDFMVAIDLYLNETTRHADLILPPSFGPEHDYYPILALGLSLRTVAKYAPAVLPAPSGVRHDWQIFLGLAQGLLARRGLLQRFGSRALATLLGAGPRRIIDLAVRLGPHGLRGRGLTLDTIEAHPEGSELGPLPPVLPKALQTKGGRLRILPPVASYFTRLAAGFAVERPPLTLISRRQQRSNNSWMHNSRRLIAGRPRCTLLMHPEDTAARGLTAGSLVTVTSEVGSLEVAVEPSDEMIRGVVSLPHGWGHDRAGARLQVAAERSGASINDITRASSIDAVSGCTSFALPVVVTRRLDPRDPAPPEPDPRDPAL